MPRGALRVTGLGLSITGRVGPPRASAQSWRAWVGEAADRLRGVLVTQPAALHVYLTRPVVSPAAVARMDAMMDVLRRALDNEHLAQRAYAAVHTYTIGFAALEASRSGWAPGEGGHSSNASPGNESDLSTEPQRVSRSPDLVHRLAAYTTPDQFRQGLDFLLDGIEHDAA